MFTTVRTNSHMATFKNTSMPSSTHANKRNSNGERTLRTLLFLVTLAGVSAASIAATWFVMTRVQAHAAELGLIDKLLEADKGSGAATTSEPVLSASVSEPVHEFVPPPAPIFFELAPFTVTVENGITERILHVGMTLRLADEMSRHRLENYLPEVRNRILLELAKLSPDDLKGAQGRVDLASAIVDTLNRPFVPQPVGQYVTDVLFTAFVVQ